MSARLDADEAAGSIPGAALLVGGRAGDVFALCTGLRDITQGDPLRPDAIWRIYSMTKSIVSIAALVLVERGLLFTLLMMQTSSAAQRQHYRGLTRAMVYAALDA